MFLSQSSETVIVASRSQKETQEIGIAFCASLYQKPLTIFLQGELGAGKTTLVRGLGLGLPTSLPFRTEPVLPFEALKGPQALYGSLPKDGASGLQITSPTYALENRYEDVLLHIDFFRIEPKEAHAILAASEEFPGVRVVEWSERLEDERSEKRRRGEENKNGFLSNLSSSQTSPPSISVTFHELSPTERRIEITFNDIALPDRATIEGWREEVKLPEHIAKHCDIVGVFARTCAEMLLQRGIVARPKALQCAGELHDLFRFIDFLGKDSKEEKDQKEVKEHWQKLRTQYRCTHEEACAAFLEEQGYTALAAIVRPHGLRTIDVPRKAPFDALRAPRGAATSLQTIEQELLFYADKRVLFDRVVSLAERFEDFTKRYGKGVESKDAKRWREKTQELERELFGEEVP